MPCIYQMDDSLNKEDKHVTVLEKATGKILSGDDAPLASQLEAWLEANPGYVPAWNYIEMILAKINVPYFPH